MFNITITSETAESLFRDILIQDYRDLKKEISKLESKDDLKEFEKDDLESNLRWAKAIEVLMEYYIAHEEMERLLKNYK